MVRCRSSDSVVQLHYRSVQAEVTRICELGQVTLPGCSDNHPPHRELVCVGGACHPTLFCAAHWEATKYRVLQLQPLGTPHPVQSSQSQVWQAQIQLLCVSSERCEKDAQDDACCIAENLDRDTWLCSPSQMGQEEVSTLIRG